MKKRKRLLFLLLLALLLPLFVLPTAAEESDILRDFLDALPSDLAAPLEEAAGDTEKTAELVGADYLLSLLAEATGGALGESGGFLLRLVAGLILFTLLSHLLRTADSGLTRTAEAALSAALVAMIYATLAGDMTRVSAALADMCHLSDALLPAFAGLYAAAGNAGTAAVSSSGFTLLSLLLENLAAGLLLPILQVIFAFMLIGALGFGARTEGLGRVLRNCYVTLLVFFSLLLTASLGFQGNLAAAADSLSVRSVKFAVGRLIPVVGGSLGETLRTLSASLALLRGSLGTLAVAVLLSFLLPTLVSLLIHRFCLSLVGAAAGMLGAARAEKIFSDFHTLYDLAIATLAIGSVLFLLILALLSQAGLAIGGT